MIESTLAGARKKGLLERVSDHAAADSSGWESKHVSRYYSKRRGLKYRRYPKLSVCVDTASHLALAGVVDRGPKPDDIEFKPLLRAARKRHCFKSLLADCGYDAEHHHRFLHQELGVLGIIPPTRGRPPKNPHHQPPTFYRGFLHRHWPKQIYGQRWQVESHISMNKRLLDSFLRSRKRANQDRELHLRTITLNLMLTADP